MILVADPLPEGAVLVRFHRVEGEPFERSIIAYPEDGGETVVLKGLSPGEPYGPSVWRAAHAQLFPEARRIRFERRKPGQAARWVTLPISR